MLARRTSSTSQCLGTTRYCSSCTGNSVDKLSRRGEDYLLLAWSVRQNIAISVPVTPVSSHRTSGKLVTNAIYPVIVPCIGVSCCAVPCHAMPCHAAPEQSHFPHLITISIISKRTVQVSPAIASTATRYRKYRSLVMANWNEQTEQPVYIHTYRLSSESCRGVLVSGCYRHTFHRGYTSTQVRTHTRTRRGSCTYIVFHIGERRENGTQEGKFWRQFSKLVCPRTRTFYQNATLSLIMPIIFPYSPEFHGTVLNWWLG